MGTALMSFSFMAIGARELRGEIPIFQTLFVRSVVGLLITGGILIYLRQLKTVSMARFPLHTFRYLFHYMGQ